MSSLSPPPIARLANEAFTWIEFPRLLLAMPQLLSKPRANPQRVMVLPGFAASDLSTISLRHYLSALGHRVEGWGLGTNNGNGQAAIRMLSARVRTEYTEHGDAFVLIGWSMGGIIAREIARQCPDCISQVITMGSPIVGGPKYTRVADGFRRLGYDLDAIEDLLIKRAEMPLEVPTTVIYSKNDGVVAWQACLDRENTNVEHVEVQTTHLGFGFSPEVFQHIATRLSDI